MYLFFLLSITSSKKEKYKINSVASAAAAVVAWIDPGREQIVRRRIFPLVQSLLGSIVRVCVCGHKRFDLLYHLCYDSIYVVVFCLFFFLLLSLYSRCITSSVWFALFRIFLLIGGNNNNEEKNHRDNNNDMYYNGRRNDHVYSNTCRALSFRRRRRCCRSTQTHRWPRSTLCILYIIIYILYFFLSICSVVVVAAYYCSLTNCLTKPMRSFVSFVCRYIFFTLQTGFLTKPRFPSYWPYLLRSCHYILTNTTNIG